MLKGSQLTQEIHIDDYINFLMALVLEDFLKVLLRR